MTDVPQTATIDAAAPAERPRTRWGGIIWGSVLAAVAVAGVWVTSGEGRLDELTAAVEQVSPATMAGYTALAVGALLAVTGLVGLLRRAQRAAAARRRPLSPSTPE